MLLENLKIGETAVAVTCSRTRTPVVKSQISWSPHPCIIRNYVNFWVWVSRYRSISSISFSDKRSFKNILSLNYTCINEKAQCWCWSYEWKPESTEPNWWTIMKLLSFIHWHMTFIFCWHRLIFMRFSKVIENFGNLWSDSLDEVWRVVASSWCCCRRMHSNLLQSYLSGLWLGYQKSNIMIVILYLLKIFVSSSKL